MKRRRSKPISFFKLWLFSALSIFGCICAVVGVITGIALAGDWLLRHNHFYGFAAYLAAILSIFFGLAVAAEG